MDTDIYGSRSRTRERSPWRNWGKQSAKLTALKVVAERSFKMRSIVLTLTGRITMIWEPKNNGIAATMMCLLPGDENDDYYYINYVSEQSKTLQTHLLCLLISNRDRLLIYLHFSLSASCCISRSGSRPYSTVYNNALRHKAETTVLT